LLAECRSSAAISQHRAFAEKPQDFRRPCALAASSEWGARHFAGNFLAAQVVKAMIFVDVCDQPAPALPALPPMQRNQPDPEFRLDRKIVNFFRGQPEAVPTWTSKIR
jgi:hypothetical protein